MDKTKVSYKAIAILAAINKAGEVVALLMNEKSIKRDQFLTFLKKLHRVYKGEAVTLYLDNLKMHYNPDVKNRAHEYNFELIYAPIYTSPYMPIERLWLFGKFSFRKRCLLDADYSNQKSIEKLIEECVLNVSSVTMRKKVLSCIEEMKKELVRLEYREPEPKP